MSGVREMQGDYSAMLPLGMTMWRCRVDASPSCSWDAHNFKHFPFSGMTREHTRHPNPARCLPAFHVARSRRWNRNGQAVDPAV